MRAAEAKKQKQKSTKEGSPGFRSDQVQKKTEDRAENATEAWSQENPGTDTTATYSGVLCNSKGHNVCQ